VLYGAINDPGTYTFLCVLEAILCALHSFKCVAMDNIRTVFQ